MGVEMEHARPQVDRFERSSHMSQEDLSIAFAGFDLGIDPIDQNANAQDQESLSALFESFDLFGTDEVFVTKSTVASQVTSFKNGQNEIINDADAVLGQADLALAFGDFALFDDEGDQNEIKHKAAMTTASERSESKVSTQQIQKHSSTPSSQENSNISSEEHSTHELPIKDPLSVQNNDDIFGRAWELFKSRFGQIQEAQQMYDSMHMQVCTGLDGHKTVSRSTALKPVDDRVMETSFLNVLNTLDENKLRSFVESDGYSNEVLQVVDEVAAATIDRMNGSNLSETIRSLYENGGSMLPPQDMASQMMQQHIHGANCNHGGEGMASMGFPGLSMPGFSSDGTIFKSSDHSHHNYFCKKCNKVVHLHGPTCSCGGKKSDLVHLDSPQGRVIQRQIAASKVH